MQDDDGVQLFESRAIARYLINKYGKDSGLIPSDPKANALFEQAASIEAFNFDQYASGIVFERVFKLYVSLFNFKFYAGSALMMIMIYPAGEVSKPTKPTLPNSPRLSRVSWPDMKPS